MRVGLSLGKADSGRDRKRRQEKDEAVECEQPVRARGGLLSYRGFLCCSAYRSFLGGPMTPMGLAVPSAPRAVADAAANRRAG